MYGFGVDAPRDAPSHYFKEEKLYGIDITTQAWGHDYQMQARQRAGNRKGAHPTVGKLHLNLRDFKMCARRAGQLLEGVACGGLLDNLLSRPPRGRPWRMLPIAGFFKETNGRDGSYQSPRSLNSFSLTFSHSK